MRLEQPPKTWSGRPTLDRIRESLFNILAPRIAGSVFLDLFAGTGANGIEALSRGAQQVAFVDSDGDSIGLIQRNLRETRLESNAFVLRATLPQGLNRLKSHVPPADIIFADPPYGYPELEALLHTVESEELIATGGIIVVEHDMKDAVPARTLARERVRETRYGSIGLSFFA